MYLYLLRTFCICNCIYYDFFKSNCSCIYYKKKVCNCNCIYYIFFEYRAHWALPSSVYTVYALVVIYSQSTQIYNVVNALFA